MKAGFIENRCEYRDAAEFDASFRVLSFYDVGTDSVVSRFDVLLNTERNPNDQYNLAFSSTLPAMMGSDQGSYLFVPPKGALGALAVNMNRQDLCKALRELADAIEAHKRG